MLLIPGEGKPGLHRVALSLNKINITPTTWKNLKGMKKNDLYVTSYCDIYDIYIYSCIFKHIYVCVYYSLPKLNQDEINNVSSHIV